MYRLFIRVKYIYVSVKKLTVYTRLCKEYCTCKITKTANGKSQWGTILQFSCRSLSRTLMALRVISNNVTILVSGCRPTSDSVGIMTFESGVVEILGVATGIPLISQSSPEI